MLTQILAALAIVLTTLNPVPLAPTNADTLSKLLVAVPHQEYQSLDGISIDNTAPPKTFFPSGPWSVSMSLPDVPEPVFSQGLRWELGNVMWATARFGGTGREVLALTAEQLAREAGCDANEYLEPNVAPPCAFQGHEEEMAASILREWLNDSRAAILRAVTLWNQGHRGPMQQVALAIRWFAIHDGEVLAYQNAEPQLWKVLPWQCGVQVVVVTPHSMFNVTTDPECRVIAVVGE